MSLNIQVWNNSYRNFENQVREFNQKIQTNSLETLELDKMYETIRGEVCRLKEFAEAAQKREEELEKAGCWGPTSKGFWRMALLNTATKIFSLTGALFAIFDKNPTALWVGFGAFAVGEVFDGITKVYEYKLFQDGEHIVELSKLNKEGVVHAKLFKKFLKELREIKRAEEEMIKENILNQTSLAEHIVIDLSPTPFLDQQISSCLQLYEALPTAYRSDDLYCRMVSIFIQHLPKEDPLRIGLSALAPVEKSDDISELANQPLPIHYLPTTIMRRSTQSTHPSKSEKDEKWTQEQETRPKSEMITQDIHDPLNIKSNYDKELAYYKYLVINRFKLKKDIAFFNTPNGWRLDFQNGISPIELKSTIISEELEMNLENKFEATSSRKNSISDVDH